MKKMAKLLRVQGKMIEDPFHTLIDSQVDEASLDRPLRVP